MIVSHIIMYNITFVFTNEHYCTVSKDKELIKVGSWNKGHNFCSNIILKETVIYI